MNKFHLIVDTSVRPNNQSTHSDYCHNFNKLNIEKYSSIRLTSLFLQHDTDVLKIFKEPNDADSSRTAKPLFVHCNLVNKDFNWYNGKKSDILAILYPPYNAQKHALIKCDNVSPKIMLPSNGCLRLQLKNLNGELIENKGRYSIIYEFEFLP